MQLHSRLPYAIVAASLFALSGAVHAEGSWLSMVSEEGDWVGQGKTYYLEDIQSNGSTNRNVVEAYATSSQGDWFTLTFAAPQGSELTVGTYEGAARWPFQEASQPALSVSGNGAGCNQLDGRFEILDIEFADNGYLLQMHAQFEQHCEGMEPALFGEIVINNPAPPPALTLDVVVDSTATVRRVNGQLTVTGTVTCSKETTASLHGTVNQRANRFNVASGQFFTSVPCSTAPTKWSANVSSYSVPFNQGTGSVDVYATAYDPWYGTTVTDIVSSVLSIRTKK